MKYPDEWQGTIPEILFQVKGGQKIMTINAYHSLGWIQHFGMPVWKTFDALQVIDVACGSGEGTLASALVHHGAQYMLVEAEADSLVQAKEYAEKLVLPNVQFASLSDLTTRGFSGDIVLCSRPLNQIADLETQLLQWVTLLVDGGVLQLQWDTDPVSNGVMAARRRINQRMDEDELTLVDALLLELNTAPLLISESIFGFEKILEAIGLKFFSFLHPSMYDPVSYFSEVDETTKQKLQSLSYMEKVKLAEIMAGKIRRHTVLCVPRNDSRRMPRLNDPDYRTLIPFRSPYAELRQEADQIVFHVERWSLPINEAVNFGEVCVPAAMGAIYSAIDGKKTLEQLHRRFLPLPWDVFMQFMRLLDENGLLHLHKEDK